MKLHRPYIPIKVRLIVAERQAADAMTPNSFGVPVPILSRPLPASGGKRLAALLGALFSGPYQLHHRPALCNRRRSVRAGRVVYSPPANDPDHLVYLAVDAHGIETRVRGVGALRSDLGQLRYNKRVARNRAALRMMGTVARMPARKRKKFLGLLDTYMALAKRPKPKRKWPKRPLRSRGFR